MEVLQIDITGKMAHFRKYYANNTAMSYSMPPRTSIMGMLAAILGKPKNSYYEAFSSKNIRVGMALKTPIKKNFHRLNFLSLKRTGDLSKSFDNNDFRGMADNHVQTPFEVISGLNIQQDDITYRIFVSCFETGKELFEELKNSVLSKKQVFPISLGTAQFGASIQDFKLFASSQIVEKEVNNEFINFHSAISSERISSINFDKQNNNFIEEELLPADFKANFDRELIKMNRVLFSTKNKPIEVCYTGVFYTLQDNNDTQTIQFLD